MITGKITEVPDLFNEKVAISQVIFVVYIVKYTVL